MLQILLVLVCGAAVTQSCDLNHLKSSCDVSLSYGEKDKLFDEARRTVQCLVNNIHHRKENDSEIAPRQSVLKRMRLVKCLVHDVHTVLKSSELSPAVTELFGNWSSTSSPDYECITCLMAQFHETVTTDELWKTTQLFIVELREVEYMSKSLNVSDSAINPWVRQFLSLKNWENFGKSETSQIVGTYGSIVYGGRAQHSVIFDSMVHDMYSRSGGIPGVAAVGTVFVLGLIWNCVLLKILVMHAETRDLILVNLTISNILNLILNNFVVQLLGSSIYDLYMSLYLCLVFVGLNIYSVALYSLHGFISAQAEGPMCDFYKLYGARLLSLGSWVVACLAPARLLLSQVGMRSGHVYMLMIYVFIPLSCSVIFAHAKTRTCSISRGLTLVYAVTYFPLFVVSISSFYTKSQDHFIEPFLLIYLNAFLNPISLYMTNGRFRFHFKRYLCCQYVEDLSYM